MAIKLTDEIECIGSDGQTYIVQELTNMIEIRTHNGQVNRLPGPKELRLVNGSSVNFIDDNTFQHVQSDMILKRRAA